MTARRLRRIGLTLVVAVVALRTPAAQEWTTHGGDLGRAASRR